VKASYVTFLLDPVAGRVLPGTLHRQPDPRQPEGPAQWKVIRDAGSVELIAHVDGATTEIGRARWRDGSLEDLAAIAPHVVTDAQWRQVELALRENVRDAPKPAPPPRANTALAQHAAQAEDAIRRDREAAALRRKARLISVAAILLVVAGLSTAIVTCIRREDAPPPAQAAPPVPLEQRIAEAPTFGDALALAKPAMTSTAEPLSPAAIQLAHYTKLRWLDVSGAHATSHAQAVASPAATRGKLMCAAGEISDIARREVADRWVYVGHLRSDDGERFAFAAVGTGGDLGNRMPAKLCGAVIGSRGTTVALFGLFDLPENRMPIVEK
jgi:hypothetical protein